MNRDPKGFDCTRDPIYLLQTREWVFTGLPRWLEFEDSFFIRKKCADELPAEAASLFDADGVCNSDGSLMRLLMETDNRHGVPFVLEKWRTESVWLTRDEAEDWAKRHEYRWPSGWRVYCVCSEGKLAKLLKDAPEEQESAQ